ncbi:GDSL-type esterase/lipase family protein [Psychromicrobium sp. YIM B11713]|uniref:GDSL-type esterase/lipase family protein n=1 Tax=Psychromicrobium sp. YIM B11713 TaxID=3145233 RepID=UPI00374EA502
MTANRIRVNRFAAALQRGLNKLLEPLSKSRVTQFEILPAVEADLVMLGDSITEQGVWNEWFPGKIVLNRGISGNTTTQVLARMHAAGLTPKTRAVFLLIGTNDLTQGYPQETIVANVTEILRQIKQLAPEAKVVLQSVMPRKVSYAEAVMQLNLAYREVAETLKLEYLDLWPALADDDRGIIQELSFDKLHLNGRGYRVWFEVLQPVVKAIWDADGDRAQPGS